MNALPGEPSPLVVWTLIACISVGIFLCRYVPIALLARLRLPEWLKKALVYVPPAMMAAIIAPALFFAGGTPNIALDAPRLGAATFAALIVWKTRSVLLTVVLGMAALWGLQALAR
jgi:branched-subunit amino acid transport protein